MPVTEPVREPVPLFGPVPRPALVPVCVTCTLCVCKADVCSIATCSLGAWVGAVVMSCSARSTSKDRY